MKVTKVCCQGCGADLQIDESIRYVTCNYCNARLEIVHDTTVTHSRQLDKIERTTDHLAQKLKVLELQNDLENLDREWEKFRNAALDRDEKGQLCEPSAAASILAGIVGIGAGIAWILGCITNGVWGMALLSFPIFGISIWIMKNGGEKAEIYRVQRFRYSTARKTLVHRLERARG
ncbi:MAG: hypothetical protein ABIT37_19880 [Luteolibacter sp.]